MSQYNQQGMQQGMPMNQGYNNMTPQQPNQMGMKPKGYGNGSTPTASGHTNITGMSRMPGKAQKSNFLTF